MATGAFPGAALILSATWYKVELDVKINEWFGDFYNLIQKAVSRSNTITMDEYMGLLATFGHIAGLYVTVAVFTDFFIKHYVFRWRTAITDSIDSAAATADLNGRLGVQTAEFARGSPSLGAMPMKRRRWRSPPR